MKIVGVTGGIACGKTTVLKMLERRGNKVLNCDQIAAKIFEKNVKKIVRFMGPEIFKEGRVDKSIVRRKIFTNSALRKKLERFIHPRVFIYLFFEITKAFFANHHIVFVEIPLFFELGLDRFFDSLVIYVDEETQLQRLIQRDGEELAKTKINSQISTNKKKKLGTWTLNNQKTITETEWMLDNIEFGGNNFVAYFSMILISILLLKI